MLNFQGTFERRKWSFEQCFFNLHDRAFNDTYNKQRIFQHPVIDLNTEFLVKIVNGFKQ